jgi:inner membrane protein
VDDFSGITHVIFNLIFFGTIFKKLDASLILVIVIYSLLPDIDHPNSYATKYTGGLFGTIMYGAFGHRGIFHSILFGVILALPVYGMFESNLPYFVAVGSYTLHLLEDMQTKTPIPLLYPWKRKFSLR